MPRKSIDTATGEINIEPAFVKVYIRNLCAVHGLSGIQTSMFRFMLSEMNSRNEVNYGPRAKNTFLSDKNMSNATYNNNVKGLIDSGLIERCGRGSFRINKKFASKVNWGKVQKIEWTSVYSPDGVSHIVNLQQDARRSVKVKDSVPGLVPGETE